ncbi:RsbRD N-terminal domain-containing protein, partial [Pseudomonas sp.]|uniref:RsbRD N-terminal domain-containing protein n=1 Tax=Pseudomonas sp. TaxID=306 RepID=UPI003CC69841
MAALQQRTLDALNKAHGELRSQWFRDLEASGATRNLKDDDVRQQAGEFLTLIVNGSQNGDSRNLGSSNWDAARQVLEKLSHSRAMAGQDSQQTAAFIFSLKSPLFTLLQREYEDSPATLAEQLGEVSELLDGLGMHTIRTFQKSREAVIKRQQEELLELSTPVVKLWEGVLALPMIGTLDSQRTQVVMESLLQR